MARPETHPEAKVAANLMAGDFLQFGTRRVETFMEVQKQLVQIFEQFNREQLARAQQETELATEFAAKMTAARSMPEVMTAYQEWLSKRMAISAEDGQKLFKDTQKAVSVTMKLLANGASGDLGT